MQPLDALGSSDLRDVLMLVRGSATPKSADEVATALACSRSVARWRLERLVDAGLLAAEFAPRSGGPGAGRPVKQYAPAPETAAVEFPARRYEKLVALLAAALPRESDLGHVGEAFGRELARAARVRPAATLERAAHGVCAGLGRLGFQASVESATDHEAVLVTPTCPLRPLVMGADTGHAIDQGMWSGLIGAALRSTPARISCDTGGCRAARSSCRVTISI